MVEGTIPTFYFWEETEASGVVYAMAGSADEGGFGYFSFPLQRK